MSCGRSHGIYQRGGPLQGSLGALEPSPILQALPCMQTALGPQAFCHSGQRAELWPVISKAVLRPPRTQATALSSLTNSESHLWHQTAGLELMKLGAHQIVRHLGPKSVLFLPHQTLSPLLLLLFFPGKSNFKTKQKTCFLTNRTHTGANKYLMGKQSFEPFKVCFLRDRTKCRPQLS